jgi:tetratricopeptide (TPR) repeat protein
MTQRHFAQLDLDYRAKMRTSELDGSVALSPHTLVRSGFKLLYEARFKDARSNFLASESFNPKDPLGHAWEAASYLFEEFYRQGILTSAFFVDDKRFFQGISGKPNEIRRAGFLGAIKTAQNLASRRLAINPRDPDALFAMTLTTGMMADDASLIDKRQIDSLRFIRKSERYARQLLAVQPDSADTYLALGTANYIIGSLPLGERAFLWFGGIKGDKQLGMAQLAITASRGVYLRPFAKILLALIDLREQKPKSARIQFSELAAEFPQNPLYARELALLNHAPRSRRNPGGGI